VASAMILFLASVVSLCPAIACPPTTPPHAQSGCCHKSPTKTVPDCPYSILQKSKTNPAAAHAKWISSIVHTEHRASLPVADLTVEVPSRLVDVSDLFLRNCVLLL
jgi:hypothetical protein